MLPAYSPTHSGASPGSAQGTVCGFRASTGPAVPSPALSACFWCWGSNQGFPLFRPVLCHGTMPWAMVCFMFSSWGRGSPETQAGSSRAVLGCPDRAVTLSGRSLDSRLDRAQQPAGPVLLLDIPGFSQLLARPHPRGSPGPRDSRRWASPTPQADYVWR